MREEVVEGRRHLAQLNPLLFAPGEKVLHGTAHKDGGCGGWRGGPRRTRRRRRWHSFRRAAWGMSGNGVKNYSKRARWSRNR